MTKHVPNLLSCLRAASALPLFCLIWVSAFGPALVLFTLAAGTDFIDGWLARRTGSQSPHGRWLDFVADKILVLSALLSIALSSLLPVWAIGLILLIAAREMGVVWLRCRLANLGTPPHVSALAKGKTTAQMVCVGLLIGALWCYRADIAFAAPMLWASLASLIVAAVLTVWTGVAYWRGSLVGRADGLKPKRRSA